MANTYQDVKISSFATYLPNVAVDTEVYRQIFDENRNRIYSFAFWMTDNELEAEVLMGNVFLRAFAISDQPTQEIIDRCLVSELRELMPVGNLTLSCGVATEVESIRKNTKRIHLERAIVQLPATERLVFCMHDGEGYSHQRICRTLGLTEQESKQALCQARLRIRELVASMK